MNKRYKCSYCDKTYASRQGKSRHQKTCINKPINTEEQLVNLNIENNNIEIENLDVHVIDQNNNSESVVKTANESDNKEDEDPILEEDIKDMKYFGMEDTSFLSSEELLNSIKNLTRWLIHFYLKYTLKKIELYLLQILMIRTFVF